MQWDSIMKQCMMCTSCGGVLLVGASLICCRKTGGGARGQVGMHMAVIKARSKYAKLYNQCSVLRCHTAVLLTTNT